MIEEFRQPCIDRLVLFLFNKRIINKFDFEISDDSQITLTEEGFRKFCIEYEKWMNGKNTVSGESSFRKQIRNQVAKLKKAISKKEVYEPYLWSGKNVLD